MSSFIIDILGPFAVGRVQCRWRDEQSAQDAVLTELIARTWHRQQERCRLSGATLFNGPMARYLRHRVNDGELLLEVGPTDYASFLGTNFFNAHRGDELGWERFSNPLGTSALVISGDGYLVLGRRSEKVALHPGRIHPFGGSLEPKEVRQDGTLDVFASIARELQEELLLEPSDVQSMLCLGIVRDATIRQPELIFEVRTARSLDDLRNLATRDPDHEHADLIGCADRADAVSQFIRDNPALTPIAIAVLSIHDRAVYQSLEAHRRKP